MAEQKAASKKPAAGKVAAGKTAAVKAAQAVVDTVKKVASRKTSVIETPKEKPVVAKKIVKNAAGAGSRSAAQAKPAAADYSSEHRYRMIETAAYFIAERNGFQGDAAEHWSAAESEIVRLLGD
ncbi:MAG: DUF2934 domain-containing protein [Gallionella sp.]|nr:DUF2934 domain-containing protein [Gallionella sp.]